MESQSNNQLSSSIESYLALVLCTAVSAAGILQLLGDQPTDAETFAPFWLPFVASGLAAAGVIRFTGHPQWLRVQQVLRWIVLLLMVWVANGLLLDLLRMVGLIPLDVDWFGLAIRSLAIVAAILIMRLVLKRPSTAESIHTATWYGYAAFVLALPYPVLRTVWVFGGTLGLIQPGAGGDGFTEWLACTPWLLAAILSLLLVSKWHWIPRRLLLVAGWSATSIVATFAPSACWWLVTAFIRGDLSLDGIATWVPCIFYGSWLLWAITAAAATHAYQLRSAKDSN